MKQFKKKSPNAIWTAGIIALSLGTMQLQAADSEGNYAIRGLGSMECSSFLQDFEADPASGGDYSEWISGYLSAMNRVSEQTFDVSYIASNLEVAELVGRICLTRPEVRVEAALDGLLELMNSSKVELESDLVRVALSETSVTVRQSVLEEFVGVLVRDGYLETSRAYDDSVRDAVLVFQEERDLPTTGLPDFNTLVSAFSEQN